MIKVTFIFLLTFGLSWGGLRAARTIGANRAVPPNYLAVENCALPCWYGVRPGEHSILRFDDALAQANADGAWMFSGRTWDYGGNKIAGFRLNITPTNQLRLGDALLAYGEPDHVFLASGASTLGGRGPRQLVTEIYLYWAEGAILVNAIQPDGSLRVTPEMHIRALEMRLPPQENEEPIVPLGTPHWQGFANAAYYTVD